VPGKVFLDMLASAGLIEARLLFRTPFKSSPLTTGAVFCCRKPLSPFSKPLSVLTCVRP